MSVRRSRLREGPHADAGKFMQAHSAANVFIVAPGHVYPDVERLVSQHDTFGIVEKTNMQPARASLPERGHPPPLISA